MHSQLRLLLSALALASAAALRISPAPSSRRALISGGAAAASLGAFASPAVAAKSRDDGYPLKKPWKQTLTDYEYFVLRQGGTEPPNSSPLAKEKREGTFRCSGCDSPLFASTAKFESGTGWPSFAKPIDDAVEVQQANILVAGLLGAECRCARCGGHLGDVFLDGVLFPGTMAAVTGKRFCIDGTSLAFEPGSAPETRVKGEPKQASSPAEVELPSWLQPPKISGPA